jgi:hyaluronoglucosaminidase
VIYSNLGATANGRLLNIRADNAAFDQAALHIDYDGTANALEIVHSGSDASAQAFNVVSTNTLDSAFTVTSSVAAKTCAKIVHIGDAATTAASGLAVDLTGEDTACQGLYVDSTAVSGTTGKLLRLRNQSVDKFCVEYNGVLTSGVADGTAPFTITSITVNTNLNADTVDGEDAVDLNNFALAMAVAL